MQPEPNPSLNRHELESCLGSLVCGENADSTRYGTLLTEHTSRVDGCQHRSPFRHLSLLQPVLAANVIRAGAGCCCSRLEGCATSSLKEKCRWAVKTIKSMTGFSPYPKPTISSHS